MIIIKDIKEKRFDNKTQENTELIYLIKYLNNNNINNNFYVVDWDGKKVKIEIKFIRRFCIWGNDKGVIGYEITFDGECAIGIGKGITRSIPTEIMIPYNRIIKLKNISERCQ